MTHTLLLRAAYTFLYAMNHPDETVRNLELEAELHDALRASGHHVEIDAAPNRPGLIESSIGNGLTIEEIEEVMMKRIAKEATQTRQ